MLFILKNHRLSQEQNQYMFFDNVVKTKSYKSLTPENALGFVDNFGFKAISPMQAKDMFDFKEVSLSEMIELPF